MTFALITGASKGIGKAIAEQLASRGYNVLLVARSEQLLREVANNISSQFKVQADILSLDLSVPDAPENLYHWCIEKNYPVSILVNNAGYGLSGSFERFSPGENLNMMRVNMIALVHLCQLFLPMLRQQKESYILNIASSAAYQAIPYLSVYSATKAFVLRFSRGLRRELHGSSVSVTVISPGATDTDFVVRAKVGEKGVKTAEKVNMTPQKVAELSVNAMFAGKAELITGFINKVGAFLSWLMPNGVVEKTAMKIYE
ncbi:MAG: NAD(P)-dependent oxidoreductase [Bacteroidetes bacterium]|nr:MAG: NAD(P)-dependent oxidoreductase [Bacteroidota bacterium]